MVASWRAFLWSTVCFSVSFWICGSIKFVIYTSPMSRSSLFSKSHFFPVLRVFLRSGPVFPQSRFVKKKTCLSNFIFWALMSAPSNRVRSSASDNVSTMICGFLLLIIRGPSTPLQYSRRETVFRSASCQVLLARNMPNSIKRWQWFCQLTFCCAFQAFCPQSRWSGLFVDSFHSRINHVVFEAQ